MSLCSRYACYVARMPASLCEQFLCLDDLLRNFPYHCIRRFKLLKTLTMCGRLSTDREMLHPIDDAGFALFVQKLSLYLPRLTAVLFGKTGHLMKKPLFATRFVHATNEMIYVLEAVDV